MRKNIYIKTIYKFMFTIATNDEEMVNDESLK